MNSVVTVVIIAVCFIVAAAFGKNVRHRLPADHLSADSKDAVKLAMGLVATMAAMLLGLLVSSAKGDYDAVRADLSRMAAKVAFLDRVLALYGPDAGPVRAEVRAEVGLGLGALWSLDGGAATRPAPSVQGGDLLFGAVQRLSPHDEVQHALKIQATNLVVDLGQLRALLHAQSVPSISMTFLVVVVSWLVAIFVSFGLFAPPNATATLALMVSALAVTGAIFLILELDRPFDGLLQVSSVPLRAALGEAGP